MSDKLPEWCSPGFMANAGGAFGGEVDFGSTLGRRATQPFPGAGSEGPELQHFPWPDGSQVEVVGTGGSFSTGCIARCTPGQAGERYFFDAIGNDAFAAAVIAYRQKHGF